MKLKLIPENTVVHTLTEEEAKELLAILHKNGYKWYNGEPLDKTTKLAQAVNRTCYKLYKGKKAVTYSSKDWFEDHKEPILTLAEFKERYCEEEKPQPKFKVGDWVKIVNVRNPMMLNEIGIIEEHPAKNSPLYKVKWCEDSSTFIEDVYLEPYPEPETKPTENMETKEQNLCELLQGHEGEEFFSLAYGVVVLEEIRRGTQRGDSPDFLCVRAASFDSGTIIVNPNGKLRNAGVVDLVPSRALYEQYPLDPLKAWIKWLEEQKKFGLDIKIETYFEGKFGWEDCDDDVSCLHFRTPTDRDKCIEEIKAIIDKYSKK